MTSIFADWVLTTSGWRSNVRMIHAGGRIARLDYDVAPSSADEHHSVILPGMSNVHSHAFQRGMAGLTEVRGSVSDSFWTWRETMYRFALALTPEQLQAIAAQLYVEMLEAGFTRVGEFHYLHHDRDGRPYADIAEMSGRIIAAAGECGIGLTLLPAFYAHGNFGGVASTDRQRRFINDVDSYTRLLDACRRHAAGFQGTLVGIAPHSLRAVSAEELTALQAIAPAVPLHIHVAEQVREVGDCIDWSGRRPVEWLLEHAPVDRRWCLIHATHMTGDETRRLAASGAVAGLCPVTEANLGDGTFNATVFTAHGGRFGVGSDSNVLIGVSDELRQLELSQRLRDRARNVLAEQGGSTGEALFVGAMHGGAQALGVADAGICPGGRSDLVSLDLSHAAFAGRAPGQLLDAWIFTGARAVDCVWVGGEKRVIGGRHAMREPIARRFAIAMNELREH